MVKKKEKKITHFRYCSYLTERERPTSGVGIRVLDRMGGHLQKILRRSSQ